MGIKERKEREREMRRQQIMVAAKSVFTQRGFEKSTMEDIAREAELSAGTIYLYFKSKDELYASLCLRVLKFISIKVDHVVNDDTLAYEAKQKALLELWNCGTASTDEDVIKHLLPSLCCHPHGTAKGCL